MLPRFSGLPPKVPLSQIALPHVLEGDAVDILFLTVLAGFVALTLALISGCAALERKR